jgi:hypothetical protein
MDQTCFMQKWEAHWRLHDSLDQWQRQHGQASPAHPCQSASSLPWHLLALWSHARLNPVLVLTQYGLIVSSGANLSTSCQPGCFVDLVLFSVASDAVHPNIQALVQVRMKGILAMATMTMQLLHGTSLSLFEKKQQANKETIQASSSLISSRSHFE